MTTAGTFGKLLYCFVYASDDAVPIGAGDPKYYLGYMVEGGIESIPNAPVKTIPKYYASSAIPGGYKKVKTAIWESPLTVKCHVFDIVPFYLGTGGPAVATAGDEDYDTRLSTSGATPIVIWHEEHNELKTDQAREYYKCMCEKMDVLFDDGFLAAKLQFAIQREYDMTTDKVVRSTAIPTNRGTGQATREAAAAGTGYFRYPKAHPSIAVDWYYSAASHLLSGVFDNFAFSVETDIAKDPVEDANDYLPNLQARGKWTCSPVVVELTMDDTNAVMDTLRAMKGSATPAASGAYLKLTFPRLHANDYISFQFNQAILTNYHFTQSEAQVNKNVCTVKLEFSNYTNVIITERQTNAAGATMANAAGDYEL